ncbi:hypothetical protein IJ380_02510 [Candidatus Saccharibacteria bacterium]|nr:hypothetical protein [Candidatus Saccharibacteria bacterium]
MEIDEELIKKANLEMFERGMKVYLFSAITDKLVEKGLITKAEEKKIRKEIKEISDSLVKAKPRHTEKQ